MVKVFLDYGHGGTDPGASGSGLREKDMTLQIGRKVHDLLKGKVTVYESRNRDVTMSLRERTNKANKLKADIFISIHINSFSTSTANGIETFSYPKSANGAKLAKAIQDELVGTKLFKSNRGTKTANFHVLRESNMPAALTELGFISNAQDAKILKTKQDEIAKAVAQGILNYLGVKGNVKPSTPSKPKPAPKPKPSKPKTTTISGAKLVKNENAYFLATSNIKVRSKPTTKAKHTGTFPKGSSINYKRVFSGNGYRWLEYTGNSGNTLYLPYRRTSGNTKNWGTFHSERPKKK